MTELDKPYSPVFALAAMKSFRASRWQMFKAKVFGKKIVASDTDCTVTAYKYKGVLYMTKYEQKDPAP